MIIDRRDDSQYFPGYSSSYCSHSNAFLCCAQTKNEARISPSVPTTSLPNRSLSYEFLSPYPQSMERPAIVHSQSAQSFSLQGCSSHPQFLTSHPLLLTLNPHILHWFILPVLPAHSTATVVPLPYWYPTPLRNGLQRTQQSTPIRTRIRSFMHCIS